MKLIKYIAFGLFVFLCMATVSYGQGATIVVAKTFVATNQTDSTSASVRRPGAMRSDPSTGKMRFYWGGAWHGSPGSPIEFAGLTTNGLMYATSTQTIGNGSNLTWDNTNIALTLGNLRFSNHGGLSSDNVFIGTTAGNFTNTSLNNVGIGADALNDVTSGSQNTAIGRHAMDNLTTGANNVAYGYNAFSGATFNGSNNVAIGSSSGAVASTGTGNTLIGSSTASSLTTGSNNIAIGNSALPSVTTGSNNVSIGQSAAVNSTTADGQLSIQNAIYGVSNTSTGSTLSTGQIGIGIKNPTSQLHVTGNTNNKSLFLVETDDGADVINAYEAGGTRTLELLGRPFVQPIGAACSDETTALTTGTAKVTFRMPYSLTVTAVRASLTTAQASGSIFTVDINESGTTILSTKITIDNTEKTSTTAATPPVISDTALGDDAEITVDIDQVGTSGATGLKIWIIGY
jgi:hypothetical protein